MPPYYNVLSVGPGTFRVTSDAGVCMELLVGRERALLLDTGYGFADLRPLVRSLTPLPLVVVNTHGHSDHGGGNGYFQEPIYLHPADWALYKETRTRQNRTAVVRRGREKTNYSTHVTSSVLPLDFNEQAFTKLQVGDLTLLTDGMIFDLGGRWLEAIHLPGHTAGSTGLWDPLRETLYLGDAMNNFTWLFLPESQNRAVYLSSIRKAMSLKPKAIVFGHYTQIFPGQVLEKILLCAETAIFERGQPFVLFGQPYPDAKLCSVNGMTLADVGRADYYGVVTNKERWTPPENAQ